MRSFLAPSLSFVGRTGLALAGLVLAAGVAQAQVVTGSYVGDGSAQRRITGLGFAPDAVIIKADSAQFGVMRTSTMAGDNTKVLINATPLAPNLIKSLDPDGF